jgi:hypothetical protein
MGRTKKDELVSEYAQLLALQHTTKTDVATAAAEMLGERIGTAPCELEMPGEWVLQVSKGGPVLSVWAIRHCSNKAVLLEIAGREDLDEEVEEALELHSVLRANRNAEEVPAEQQLARLLEGDEALLNAGRIRILGWLEEYTTQSATLCDEVLLALTAAGVYWLAHDVITMRYLPRGAGVSAHYQILKRVTVSTTDLLALLDSDERCGLAAHIAAEAANNKHAGFNHLIDGVLMEAALLGDDAPYVTECTPHEWLDEDAIQLIVQCSDWNWKVALCLHELSDKQVELLIASTPWKDRGYLCSMVRCEKDYHRAKQLLKATPKGSAIDETTSLGYFFAALVQDGDPAMIATALGMLEDPTSVLEGNYFAGASQVLLPVPLLTRVLEKTQGVFSKGGLETISRVASHDDLPLDYRLALIDGYPGLAWEMVSTYNDTTGPEFSHIYQMLENSGADPRLVLDLFATRTDKPLSQVVSALETFATA